MDKVYQTLDWMKANPLMVVCLVIILASLGLFVYSQMQAGELEETLSARDRDISEIQGFERTQITAPGPEPDDPPLELNLVANSGAIEQLESIYDNLEREYRGVYDRASEINQEGHEPFLDNLFPEPSSQARRFRAIGVYAEAFEDLYAELEAGSPPTEAELEDILQQERDVMLRQLDPNTDELSEEDQEELEKRQREQLLRFIREHATNFQLFAPSVSLDIRGDWEPGPFDIGSWAQSSNPSMYDIWEGQMDLWIQQDLVRAINRANEGDDNDSVLTLPVKRLYSMRVLPGYIGADDRALGEINESTVQQAISEIEAEASDRLPQDFSVGPTGRISNAIYDVRHAELSLVADAHQIPAILNAISDVNFMTVIGMEIRDIDEYEHLREGYYYGSTDAVDLDLIIETIWLRSWTAGHLSPEIAEEQGETFNPGLMPDSVRVELGLPPRDLAAFESED